MRIMILASGDLWAGAEVMVYQLCCGLKVCDDVEILVVLLNHGRLAKELESAGFDVTIVNEQKMAMRDLIKKIYCISKQYSPHLIHSHRYKENILAWLMAMVLRKVRLVATQHGMPETSRSKLNLSGRFRTSCFFRLLSCCFGRTVLVSNEMRQSLVGSYGFRKKNVTVIHNGISLTSSEIKWDNDRLLIGSAGRLFPVKDYSLMVEIARLVVLADHDVDFVLAGDGPQLDLLKRKIKDYGIQNRFFFLGHQDDMDAFYRSLDIYINTSVHEGIPMSVLEAMSHWLPVVVPKVGGFPEIVKDGVNGFLIEGREPDDFAERIIDLTRKELRKPMAVAARICMEESFSREAMAQKYYQVYQEVLSV